MFHGLKVDLVAGKNIPAVLEFSSGMVIDIKFVIGENTTLDEDQDMDDSKEHHDHSHHRQYFCDVGAIKVVTHYRGRIHNGQPTTDGLQASQKQQSVERTYIGESNTGDTKQN